MSKIISVLSYSKSFGNEANSNTESLVGTPGSGTIPSGYYGVYLKLWICVCEDQSVYLGIDPSSWVRANKKRGTPSARWKWELWFAVAPKTFYLYSTKSDRWGASGKQVTWLPGPTFPTSVQNSILGYQRYNTLKSISKPTVGSDTSSYGSNLKKIPVTLNDRSKKATFCICGIVLYTSTSQSKSLKMQSWTIEVKGLYEALADYYPWKMLGSDGVWYSCNKTNKYLKKHGSTAALEDLKNSSDAKTSKVFIHDGSGFNVISPRIGAE